MPQVIYSIINASPFFFFAASLPKYYSYIADYSNCRV